MAVPLGIPKQSPIYIICPTDLNNKINMAFLKPEMRFYDCGKQRANKTFSEISDRKLDKYRHVCMADAW